MTDWNDDLRDMYEKIHTETASEKEFREWIESLSDDDYLDHILGKLKPPWEVNNGNPE